MRADREICIPALLLYINMDGLILVKPISPTNLDYAGHGNRLLLEIEGYPGSLDAAYLHILLSLYQPYGFSGKLAP